MLRRVILLLLVIAIPALATSQSVLAHDRRVEGKYTLVVGWQNEPTTEGTPNATFLRVFETASGRGIEGLEKTVRITVRAGGTITTYEPQLRPLLADAGSYVGDILPTRPGDYTFLVKGKIEELEVKVTALVRKPGESADTELVYELTMPAPAAPSPTPPPSLAPSTSPTSAPTFAVAAPIASPAPVPAGDQAVPALALAGLLGLVAIAWGVRARAGRR